MNHWSAIDILSIPGGDENEEHNFSWNGVGKKDQVFGPRINGSSRKWKTLCDFSWAEIVKLSRIVSLCLYREERRPLQTVQEHTKLFRLFQETHNHPSQTVAEKSATFAGGQKRKTNWATCQQPWPIQAIWLKVGKFFIWIKWILLRIQ